MQPRSIGFRLRAFFALLILLVVALGVVGVQGLAAVNRESEIIRNHWLQDTRILGDLSNYMSDYRAAEATQLLSSTPLELEAGAREIDALRAIVSRSQRSYEQIVQDPPETALYLKFADEWRNYQSTASRVLGLARDGRAADGVVLYMTGSRHAFDLASDSLARLTDQTVRKAQDASGRAAQAYRRARLLIVMAVGMASALLLGVIIYISRSLLNPLLQLAQRMHELAGHDTDVVIEGAGRADEMGEMARSVVVFRDNAVALMNSQRRLIEQAAALEQALENERRLTVQQRNFVSMTSHEFRTPLTVIDGHAQRLIKLNERLEPTDIAERGARIRSAVRRMTNIMDGLLDASRLLDGKAVFNPVDFQPAVLLHEACQVHREATRGANITEDIDGLPQTMTGDSRLLFHAFSNLISNAVKYSALGSPVEVRARVEADDLVIRVRDHGIGIPGRDRERLFQRYFRGGNATGIAGTGVGLHLVAMVAELHQGEVFAESLEGVGSLFVVRIPVRSSRLIGRPLADRALA